MYQILTKDCAYAMIQTSFYKNKKATTKNTLTIKNETDRQFDGNSVTTPNAKSLCFYDHYVKTSTLDNINILRVLASPMLRQRRVARALIRCNNVLETYKDICPEFSRSGQYSLQWRVVRGSHAQYFLSAFAAIRTLTRHSGLF